jgi:hypothetical protein
MSDSDTGHRDQASSSIDPGSEDVKHSREVARDQARWVRQAGITTHYDQLSFAGHQSAAKLLGVFQVSILHNLVHLGFGVAGIALSRTMKGATYYLLVGGAVYFALWLYGVAVGQHSAGNFVPVNDADNWLHLGLSVAMVLLGLIGRRAQIAPGEPVSR